jgi:arginine/lysine/ornithine decarboxylase
MISGGIPVYIPACRNAWGLIGPMRWDAFDEGALRERIRTHPLVKDPEAWRKPRPFRVAVVEQCTYDGTIHSAEMIVAKIGHLCDYILFDEAWAGFMKFHPLYAGRFAMGLANLGPDSPGIIATQSTHKQLASFSQASQIHIKDRHITGQRRRVEHRRFNESFMQHASTSPFYPLFASLDVGAQMMKGRSGEVLWDDTIRLGIELRKKIRTVAREFQDKESRAERRWFFEPFVPDRLRIKDAARPDGAHDVAWESVATDMLASDPACWALSPQTDWHGFPHMVEGFAMTDPNKLTLLTPGFNRKTGEYEDHGIPAPIVAQYLRENRIVAEKNDLNSLLFLLTPGVEASKASTLISSLVAFKRLHDENVLLAEAIPEFASKRAVRYAGVRLRDLCNDMHGFFRAAGVSAMQAAQFAPEHLPDMAMTPREAAKRLVRNEVDYLHISAIAGRIATTPFVVYPPGIATIVPGERLAERAAPMIAYLTMFEAYFNAFPGFDVEIQGLYREVDGQGRIRLHTYVVAED